jgi:putative endopeptidase
MKPSFWLAASASLAVLAGASAEAAPTAAPNAAPNASGDPTATPHYGTWGFDLTGRNTKVKPGDDFFSYANGAFIERTQIPPDRVRFGNFDVLTVLSENRVKAILESADKSTKIGAFYGAYMDEARVEALGYAPLKPDLERIAAAASRDELIPLISNPRGFHRPLFSLGISADAKSPSRYAVYSGSGGLGLPDKDYYLKPSFAEKKARYEAYVADMLTLIGWPDAAAKAKDVVAFETRLAEVSWERAQRRDRDKTYNAMTPDELAAYAPGFDFKRMLAAGDLSQVNRIVVSDNTAFPKKAAIFAETPLDTLKAWAAFGAVDTASPYLSSAFVQKNFEFRSKTLAGQPELRARWKRAVSAANSSLGEAVGEVYVARYFPPDSKAKMLALVGNIKTALSARINTLDWMSPETKTQAQDKLAHFTVKIGYPDHFRDYSKLDVKSDDLYGNMVRADAFEWNRDIARLNQPVDRTEWGMSPQTVNAYYNSTLNEIVFPAAILQPPFFDPKADPAVNYGGIGGVIGHEISHGFDDQGRKSNGEGVLKDWWTAEDAAKFEAKATRLGAQYESLDILPGEHINGKLTMGENIGDMGGLNLALDAYRASLKGKKAPVIGGLTGDQRVFFGWAQVWREKMRDDARIQQLHTDPHSPGQARVNGVVRNIDAWYRAFGVKPGDKLYVKPEDRVKIW